MSTGEGRLYHTATLLLDGRVLVAGGMDGTGSLATAELYDPTSGSWTATGTMLGGHLYHTATLLLDGRVLVVGGAESVIDSFASGLAELYDPVSGSWTASESLGTPRLHHTATLLPDGKVLVVGGRGNDSFSPLASAELYDPDTRVWTAVQDMAEFRNGHTATLLSDGRVLVTGGVTASESAPVLASAELYDPRTGSWTAAAAMGVGRSGHTATLLLDDNVLVAGSGPQATLRSAEVYDATTGSWTAVGAMGEPRWGEATATLLSDGRVLVAGGYDSSLTFEAQASAELYDPISGSWTDATGMTDARHGHSATLLRSGIVLVVGGGGETLTSVELFNPGSAS